MRALISSSRVLCVAGLLALGSGIAQASDLAQAAQAGDVQRTEALLRQGEDPDGILPDGSTALLWATYHDQTELALALLRAGADPERGNDYGITPLSEAARNGNVVILNALLDAGIDADRPLREGETALMVAASTGNIEALRRLIAHGADVNRQETWKGQSALMWAAAQNHADVVRVLLEAGANPDLVSREVDFRDVPSKQGSVKMNFPRGGLTALLFAARNGALDAVRALLDGGADIDLGDPDDLSPLTMAITNFHYDVAALLIERGCDVNTRDDYDRTALWAAVDMHTLDYSNRPDTIVADTHDALDIIRLLLARPGIELNATIRRPITARAVLDAPDSTMGDGSTAFLRAARGGDLVVLQALVEAGADYALPNANGATALMMAAGLGWRDGKTRGSEQQVYDAIRYMLDLGMDVNARDAKGNTALHGAAYRGVDSVIGLLIDHGADVQAVNEAGETPLDTAKGVGGVREPLASTVALLEALHR